MDGIQEPVPLAMTEIEIEQHAQSLDARVEQLSSSNNVITYKLTISGEGPCRFDPVLLKWKIPALDIQGIWQSDSLYQKRLEADWELEATITRICIGAPVFCLFGNSDLNRFTFSCQDGINTHEMGAKVREEDGMIYCWFKLFGEQPPISKSYETILRFDFRPIHFARVLEDVARWWGQETYKPMTIPATSLDPVYSTWYSYHQKLSVPVLLEECKIALELGYSTIILDDGWQTTDANRGYDFTGDWLPDGIPDLGAFIKQLHQLNMKVMIWYSVPFCGIKSRAYQRFKGKYLTENHRWAPVFDPRYPQVRSYLIEIYLEAVKTWDLDGLKLDFVDDFKAYPDTPLEESSDRDFVSVNEAVDQLFKDLLGHLMAIKPDVLIEFRQKYIGPAMKQYGNMFRAFDCPHDGVTNRIRTTDIRLLSGDSATHGDMITWNYGERVEVAALQLLNCMFSVPQISVRLQEIPVDHLEMLRFYTQYWIEQKEVLMKGKFKPSFPLANYPIVKACSDSKSITAVYSSITIPMDKRNEIDIINGTLENSVVYTCESNLGRYHLLVWDCQGHLVEQANITLHLGVGKIAVPASGLIRLTKL